MSDVLTAANWYAEHGFSVIPVKADGSKSPSHSGWAKYRTEPADLSTREKWFRVAGLVGIGVCPGPASGNLVVLDFENHGESAYFEWYKRLTPELRAVADTVPTVVTPSGGRHVWVRLTESQPGAKLARYAEKGKTKIEIRGEGHQVLVPGCPAECHATGKLYDWANDPGDFSGCEITPEVWTEFVEVACQCNEYQPPEQPRDRDVTGAPAGADSPGNDFNARGSWAETGLFDAGWTWAKQLGPERGFLTRPDKSSGISGTIGWVNSQHTGYPYLYVWTTSTNFAAETPYSRFTVFALLKHGGDYKEAAKSLHRMGYGERLEMTAKGHSHGVDLSALTLKFGPDGKPYQPFGKVDGILVPVENEVEKEVRIFRWMSELNEQSDDVKWIWEGYLARGGITLFSALWKSGKSTLLSHLLKALDGSATEFIGQPVSPARVLYVTEEAENIWADRRDKLLIGDHVGMVIRPFQMRPTMQEWREFLAKLGEAVRTHQFDLVVFDTLSKLWPVREENDAGQVEEALMYLWSLSQGAGVAVLLVHHARKSGGAEFVASRGSGGLPSFCEVIIEFRRATEDPKETKRVLTAQGRYGDQTPVKLLAELQNGRYVGLGDPDDAEVQAQTRNFQWEPCLREVFRKAAEEDPEQWLTRAEIRELLREAMNPKTDEEVTERPLPRPAIFNAVIDKWAEEGELEQQGKGVKGDPFLYRLPTI